MRINQMKQVEVDAKTLKLCLKVRDDFTAGLYDQDDKELKDYSGYVPDFMPGDHHGDYVMLHIDIDSGQITNWVKPTQEQIEDFIKETP